ncbi:MAG: dephospho-CoA kinase [Candidatus ainarchaeum sp.]|nr:dephospho-CoA kinase [Candidatus ainarchaeum sp.]
MLRVALTGNIATGKTTALNFFSKAGAPTINCDEIVSELYKKPEAKAFLEKNFGATEKKEIAKQIFPDTKKRVLLESFFHPLVFSEIDSRIKKLEKKGKKIVIVEVPLLFETGHEKNFSRAIVVKATQVQQAFRLQKQGFSSTEALARMKSQKGLEHKLKKADFIIDNTGSFEETKKQALKILKILNLKT